MREIEMVILIKQYLIAIMLYVSKKNLQDLLLIVSLIIILRVFI